MTTRKNGDDGCPNSGAFQRRGKGMQVEKALKAVCERHKLDEKVVLKNLPWLKAAMAEAKE